MRCIPRLDRSQQDVSRINECSGIHCARRYLPVHQQLASARGVSMDTRGVIGLAHRYITAMQSIETGHGAQARSQSLHLAIDDTSTYLSADSLPPASGECGSGAHSHNHTGGVRPTSPHMQRQPSRLQAQHSSNPPSAKGHECNTKATTPPGRRNRRAQRPSVAGGVGDAVLRQLAQEFAAAVPEATLSTAEVQALLMQHRRAPAAAVAAARRQFGAQSGGTEV